jgi:hypothetical protein
MNIKTILSYELELEDKLILKTALIFYPLEFGTQLSLSF